MKCQAEGSFKRRSEKIHCNAFIIVPHTAAEGQGPVKPLKMDATLSPSLSLSVSRPLSLPPRCDPEQWSWWWWRWWGARGQMGSGRLFFNQLHGVLGSYWRSLALENCLSRKRNPQQGM
jgi:hypothetical protein